MTITLSANAWKRLQHISNISKTSTYINKFLLSAKSGGCNGFTYNFVSIDNEKYENIFTKKLTIVKENDILVMIDPMSEFILFGTHIDFTKEDFEEKFVFTRSKNNEGKKISNCGCGKSFSI